MMERSPNIFGPYTEVKQLNYADRAAMEPNQGGLVQAESGAWYWVTHHGRGAWEGRCVSLVPVRWVDGWPIIGEADQEGIGHFVWSGKKPVASARIVLPQTSDEFVETSLPPQWEWNFQPRADKWSLTEHPGWLRLHSFRPIEPGDLKKAGNTLTQRSFRTTSNEAVVKFDLRGMADGQRAGLCHFAKDVSALGVRQRGMVRTLEYEHAGKITSGPVVKGNLWVKSKWGLDGKSQYSYSLDGRAFTEFGNSYQLSWGNYRGDRIGLYSYNGKQDSGYVDIDYFRYNVKPPQVR